MVGQLADGAGDDVDAVVALGLAEQRLLGLGVGGMGVGVLELDGLRAAAGRRPSRARTASMAALSAIRRSHPRAASWSRKVGAGVRPSAVIAFA